MSDQKDCPPAPHRRVLLIQFAGDYREGYTRLASGEAETYQVEPAESLGASAPVVRRVSPKGL